MRLPQPLILRSKQRTAFRFFDTAKMMDFLSVYYGTKNSIYTNTWGYRTLIAIHREQQIKNMYRKGYGVDWKCIRRAVKDGREQWIPDKAGIGIKEEVLISISTGKLPLVALTQGSALLREIEQKVYIEMHVRGQTGVSGKKIVRY